MRAQPIGEWIQGGVAGQEARNKQDRAGPFRLLIKRPHEGSPRKACKLSHRTKFVKQVHKRQVRIHDFVTYITYIRNRAVRLAVLIYNEQKR